MRGLVRKPSLDLESNVTDADRVHSGACPECGASLLHAGGCVRCRECGFSPCE